MLINLRNALMTGKRLPYDAEVEFLESTGTQWIDTGIVGDNTVTFTGLVYRTSNAANECAVGSLSASFTRCWLSYFYVGKYRLGYGRLYSDPTTAPIGEWLYQELKHESGNANLYANGVVVASVPIETFTTGLNMYIGAMNSAGSASYTFKGKMAGIQIYKSGVLVRDYIPVRKGAVGYLYDRVSGKLFGNAGAGDFVLGPDVVPVEYIESHGTEWIDTGRPIPSDFWFDATIDITGTSSAYKTLLGARTGSGIADYQYSFEGNYNNFLARYGTSSSQYFSSLPTGMARIRVESGGKLYINESFVLQLGVSSPSAHNVYIFALNNNGTVSQRAQYIRLYSLKYGGVNEERNFRPVRVGTEGAMMDTLTRRIYRNAGTGAFTYGNDLKYPIPAS